MRMLKVIRLLVSCKWAWFVLGERRSLLVTSRPERDMASADKYVRENVWVVVVPGIIFVTILIIIVTSLICCYRRRRRRRRGVYYVNLRSNHTLRYGSMELQKSLNTSTTGFSNATPTSNNATPVKSEEGVAEAWNNQRKKRESSEREAALLTCQYYLRNTKSYSLTAALPDLGSRVAKYWYQVTPTGQGSSGKTKMILTLLPVAKQCTISLQKENLNLLNELLATLKHPYLYSVEHVDYLSEQASVVMVTTFFPRGSLKDVIYKCQPTNEWSEKYSIRRRGLPPETVALYGRQILEALLVLYKKGFPPLGNLHSGNVFVDGKVCRLSGYENTLLGYRSRHYRLVKGHMEAIDTITFGHLLFEMMCGYELTTLSPSNGDWGNVRSTTHVEVLRYIFGKGDADDATYPNIAEILELPFFNSVQLPEIESWDSSQIQLSPEMKGLLRGVRKGRDRSDSTKERSLLRKKSFPRHENYYPITQAPQPTTGTSSQGSTHPPPPTSHPPSVTSSQPPSITSSHPPTKSPKERGALLSDIRRGTDLKRTVTNDRSTPRI